MKENNMLNFKFGDILYYIPDGKECVFIEYKEDMAVVIFKNYDFLMRVSPKLLIYDDTNINIGKKNFTESGKLHTIDKECARRYLEGKIFFGFIIDTFNRIINRINEIEDVINQK